MNIKKMEKVTIGLFLLAVVYTILVKVVDVQSIGPNNSSVGFATINDYFRNIINTNDTWYKITKYLGVFPFLYVLFYGLIGVKQLLDSKKIAKVDKKILALGCFYVLVGLVYIFFEKVIINYRPVLEDNVLEASYPSSHTMLAVCVCLSSIFMNQYYIKNNNLRKGLYLITWILMILLVVGRFLSGVHWFTDIVGGILISLSLVSLFYTVCKRQN